MGLHARRVSLASTRPSDPPNHSGPARWANKGPNARPSAERVGPPAHVLPFWVPLLFLLRSRALLRS